MDKCTYVYAGKVLSFLLVIGCFAAPAASIEHIALEIENPASMVKWWTENLGFKVTLARPTGSTFIQDEAGRIAFELYRPSEGRKAPDYHNMPILQLHFGLFNVLLRQGRLRWRRMKPLASRA